MLEAAKDKHFVAPGLAWLINTARNAGEYGIKPGSPSDDEVRARARARGRDLPQDASARHPRARSAATTASPGRPRARTRRIWRYFVDLLGFSPMEAILAATKLGGEIMGMGDELGQIKPGYLADMLLVDGDPIANIRVLAGQDAPPRDHEGRGVP